MNALALVKDERNPEVLRIIKSGNYTLVGLEQQFGISSYYLKKDYGAKSLRRGRPKKAAVAPLAPKPAPQKPAPAPAVDAPRITLQTINRICIGLAGLALGGVGAFFNFQYWYAFGGLSFGVLGGAIDGVTVFLPASLERRLSHVPLFGLWLLCAGLSTIAALGFAANNIGDSLQGREAVVQRRSGLETELASAKVERWKITETRDPASLEQLIQAAQLNVPPKNWVTSSRCTDLSTSIACLEVVRLREAKANALRRGELETKIHDLSEKIATLPPVASKDPGADYISQVTFGHVGAGMVDTFRVLGFAFMPSLAGFLMAFARMKLQKDNL